jgi:hypothetical protein
VQQTILTSLFPSSAPRAGNVLLSWNSRSLKESIPLYEELVRPFSSGLVTPRSPPLSSEKLRALDAFSSSISSLSSLARLSLPSDSDLSLLRSALGPLGGKVPSPLPPALRELAASASSPLRDALGKAGLLDRVDDAEGILEQLPPIFEAVAGGQDFELSAGDLLRCVEGGYAARRTLVVQFEGDAIDQSDLLYEGITKAGRGGERDVSVELRRVPGGHLELLTDPKKVAGEVAAWLEKEFG